MPRIKSFKDFVTEKDRAELVDTLAAELKNTQTIPSRQPLILEQELRQTKSIHVLVFWDRWGAIPREQRGSIIMDAYEKVEPDVINRILVAMGLTFEEAIEMNFLPYQIQTTISKEDPINPDDLKRALIEEGAVQTTRGLQLRLPTEPMAHAAYERLAKKFPGPYFAIAKTVARTDN